MSQTATLILTHGQIPYPRSRESLAEAVATPTEKLLLPEATIGS